jgi:hypothetical protein
MTWLAHLSPEPRGRVLDARGVEFGVSELESKVGAPLDTTHVELLKRYRGAAIGFDEDVVYRPEVPSPWARADGTQSLEVLFGLVGEAGLLAQVRRFEGRIPRGTVPVGEAPGGNLILIALTGRYKGSVYLWDHENEREITGEDANDFGNVHLISKSFASFLGILQADLSEDLDEDDGVVDAWLDVD